MTVRPISRKPAEPSPTRPARSARPLAIALALSLRPSQWTKNLIVFAGLIFGQRLLDPDAIVRSAAAFAVFCALSGVVYLVNDIADRAADRSHPLKRFRPIASGEVPVGAAVYETLRETARNGFADLDMSSVMRLREEQAGVQVRTADTVEKPASSVA